MRSNSGGFTVRTSAAMLAGVLAFANIGPALAQTAPAAAAAPAKKPMTDAEKKDAAKAAYKGAEEKFDKGDFAGALALYREADSLVPGSQPKYKAAQCLDKMNSAREAVAAYQAFLDSGPDAEKYKEKITDAKARQEALMKTPAKVKVAFQPEMPPGVTLTVDGAPQASAEVMVAPGKHTVMATAEGYDAASADIDVTFGDTKDVTLVMNRSMAPVAAVAPPPAPPAEPVSEPRSDIPAYVTLGLAGAGAIVGTIFGIQALGSKSDYEATPTQELFDDTERSALLADMSFGVAITFGVTGLVLLLSGDDSASTKTGAVTTTAPKQATISRPLVLPYVGPNGGGAAATMQF